MIDRRDLLAGIGAAIVPALAGRQAHAQTAAAPAAAGMIANLLGDATARQAGKARALAAGEPLFAGEQVQTGADSRLQASLGAATRLYMGERTRVMIDAHLIQRGGAIHLGAGAMMFERKPPDPKTTVSIRSPFALLAVRGTTVFAGPSNGVFGIFVSEGEVDVRAAGIVLTLRPGEGTNIAKPGARPTPAAAWGDARIQAALRSVR